MYQEKINKFFEDHRDEMFADIAALVKINSVRSDPLPGMPFGQGPADALAAMLKMAADRGFIVKHFDNYAGTINLHDGETPLGILAHLDIVAAGDGWDTPPFEVTEKDGKIYGRGTADDKGPAIAALYALCAAREIAPDMKNVRIILGTDEESGSSDIAYYFKKEAPPPNVFTPDSDFPVINVEKGRFCPVFVSEWEASNALPRVIELSAEKVHNIVPVEARCIIEGADAAEVEKAATAVTADTGITFKLEESDGKLKITARGVSAHAARPFNGNNSLTGLLTLLVGLPLADCGSTKAIKHFNKLFPHGDTAGKTIGFACSDELSGDLTLNLSILNINETGLRGKFDCRSPVAADQQKLLVTLTAAYAEGGITIEQDGLVAPHVVPEDSEFVKTLLSVYEQYTGNKGECLSIGGATYAHGIPGGVAYGCAMPGVDNRMHGANEFAVVEDLILSAKIFTQVILNMCAK